MKINKFMLFFLTLLSIFSTLLVSCEKEHHKINTENSFTIQMTPATEADLIKTTNKWHITQKRICVIFGYDFNEKEQKDKLISLLSERYGLVEDGGLICTYTYPDDFKAGGRSYWNNLRLTLQNDFESLDGLIILGAPERTHDALARNQDFWNMKVPYPVIALFPQDDVLGLESTCDIVLDKGQSINYNGQLPEDAEDSVIIHEAPEILTATIDYIAQFDGNFIKDKTLSQHVFNMYKGHKIHHYIDPETGLQSVNHFILN